MKEYPLSLNIGINSWCIFSFRFLGEIADFRYGAGLYKMSLEHLVRKEPIKDNWGHEKKNSEASLMGFY